MAQTDMTDIPVDINLHHITPEQQVRSVALMLAVKYHTEMTVKDVGMYQQMKMENKTFVPSHPTHVIEAAVHFEQFLLGRYSGLAVIDRATGKPLTADEVKRAVNEIAEGTFGSEERGP